MFIAFVYLIIYFNDIYVFKTRRPDEAADYRATKRYVYEKKISQTLQSVE